MCFCKNVVTTNFRKNTINRLHIMSFKINLTEPDSTFVQKRVRATCEEFIWVRGTSENSSWVLTFFFLEFWLYFIFSEEKSQNSEIKTLNSDFNLSLHQNSDFSSGIFLFFKKNRRKVRILRLIPKNAHKTQTLHLVDLGFLFHMLRWDEADSGPCMGEIQLGETGSCPLI